MRLYHFFIKYILHILSVSTIATLLTFVVVVSNDLNLENFQSADNSSITIDDEQSDSRSSLSSATVADDNSETLQHYNINNSIPTNRDVFEPFDNTKRNLLDVAVTPNSPSSTLPLTTNGLPSITLDRNIVEVAQGDTAVNSGRIENFDPYRMQIQPSAGTIEMLPDGSWLWTYPANSAATDKQIIVLNIMEYGATVATESFTVTQPHPVIEENTTGEAIRVDQNFLEVEHGKLAINTGKIDGLQSRVVASTASVGALDFMPDGSWIWMYPTEYETTETDAQNVVINVETDDGLVFQTSFTFEVSNFSATNVVIAPIINQNVTINQYLPTPTILPTHIPPTDLPTLIPTDVSTQVVPTDLPTLIPTNIPTDVPTNTPTNTPTDVPTNTPTDVPTSTPTDIPTSTPTDVPTNTPTDVPTNTPTHIPTNTPTDVPTDVSSQIVTNTPTDVPTSTPTDVPTNTPTDVPTNTPTDVPTNTPTDVPTNTATNTPTDVPTNTPTDVPTSTPTDVPTNTPTDVPTSTPTNTPTDVPTNTPTDVPTQAPPTNTPFVPAEGAYYVSRNGNNQDGRSWNTAWSELDRINWSVIQPGDVIYLDGGNDQMTYERELNIQKSGSSGQPILIQVSSEAGHNGQVIIFGGRSIPLPYCGQSSYDTSNEGSIRTFGIRTNNHQNIVIDGLDWRGIVIHGFKRNGLRIDSYSSNITLRNVEIYNNGYPRQTGNGWQSDEPGIRMGGTNITIQRSIVHDNGQDAIQGAWQPHNVVNLRVEQSWLYNGRQNPTRPNESWNHCTHTDGIQIYAGNVFKGITVTETVIGPGFMQNLILGQTLNSYNEYAHVQDVLLEDVLLMKATGNNVYGYHNTESHNWTMNRVTLHCPSTGGQCLNLENSDHSMTDSIIYGGRIQLPDGLDHYQGNCVWNLISTTVQLGITANPNFVNVSDSDRFSLDDYTVQNPNCIGSRITSVQQLLSGDFGDVTPSTIPTEVPTTVPTTVPTQAPTIVPTVAPTQASTQVPTTVPTIVPTAVPTDIPAPSTEGVYYVSKNGNNQDGQTWGSAWNEFDQINWGIIQPGDVIYVDGGTSQMSYGTTLRLGQSGTPSQPIRIQSSIESGHDGQVVFFGGRNALLPYCGQANFDNSNESSLRRYGIDTNGHDNIHIDGMDWNGIAIHGFLYSGIVVTHDSQNVTVSNIEVYNNGRAIQNGGGWTSDLPGVRIGGTNVVFQRAIIHDNGQDAFQGSNEAQNVANFRLEESWLYNGRQHPSNPNEAWNHCRHSDGIQIYAGGVISGITVKESVIGPGFMQNLILGQTPNMFGEFADVQDVTLEDTLLMKATSNNVYGYSNTNSQNWNLNRVTIHCPPSGGVCVQIHNNTHSITDSIIHGGRIYMPQGLNNYSGNCVWNLISSSVPLGENTNPNFVNISDSDYFSLDDYTVQNPACLGSRVTSVQSLLSGAYKNNPILASIARTTSSNSEPQALEAIAEPTLVPVAKPLSLTSDNLQVNATEGSLAVNSGQLVNGNASIASITTSLGTVSILENNIWEWAYTPEDGPAYDQLVTIDGVDADGMTTQTSFILNVDNVPPTGEFSYTVVDTVNPSIALTFVNITDVSLIDNSEGFTFQYDCNGDGTFEMVGILSSVVCEVETLAQVNSVARILDKDGGFTDYLVDTATLATTIVPATIAPQITATTPAIVPSPTAIIISTDVPTDVPPVEPTLIPTIVPTVMPTIVPTDVPTQIPPTAVPTLVPTAIPTEMPTLVPTAIPTDVPLPEPTAIPADESNTGTVDESEPEQASNAESDQA